MRIAVPDLVTNSYLPALAAEELRYYGAEGMEALEGRELDGFWTNTLGSETAVHRGVGKTLIDVWRGDAPPGARDYTFSALVATDAFPAPMAGGAVVACAPIRTPG